MGNFLDKQGVTHLWGKAKETFELKGAAKAVDDKLANYIPTSQKGANNGVATLDGTGKVPTSQLPSYVSDVFEFANKTSFPTTGEANKIYVAKDTNLTYRWSGTAYVEISPSLALGETSETAYAGDKGKQLRTDFDAHKSDTDIHITAAERTKWNGNTNNTGTVTQITAGAGLKTASGNAITTTGEIKANLKSETKKTSAAGTGKLYPVELDSNGQLAVEVSWTDNNTTYTLDSSKSAPNGSTKINLTPSSGNAQSVVIKGAGAATVTSDETGTITVNSTNTDTKVTAVGNHYIPTGTDDLDAAESIEAPDVDIVNTPLEVVTGVKIDKAGHLTGLKSKVIKSVATNNKGTVTSVTAGAGLSGGTISTSGTIKVALKSETKNSAAVGTPSAVSGGKFYPVEMDSAGVLAVSVPWTDNNTTYTALSTTEIDEAIAAAG